jgi:transposase
MGRPPKDHRTILNALLWLLATGAPWRDLPDRYGLWRTVASRFYRWLHLGLWPRLLAELQREADAKGTLDWEVHMVDGTNVRAHRHAAGARGRHTQALGRSRGGFGTKLHLRCDRRGKPLALVLTGRERNERTAPPELMSQGAIKRSGPGRPKLRPGPYRQTVPQLPPASED